eukprot:scaffold9696_cov112-Isochrysis_galbana.AAC.1
MGEEWERGGGVSGRQGTEPRPAHSAHRAENASACACTSARRGEVKGEYKGTKGPEDRDGFLLWSDRAACRGCCSPIVLFLARVRPWESRRLSLAWRCSPRTQAPSAPFVLCASPGCVRAPAPMPAALQTVRVALNTAALRSDELEFRQPVCVGGWQRLPPVIGCRCGERAVEYGRGDDEGGTGHKGGSERELERRDEEGDHRRENDGERSGEPLDHIVGVSAGGRYGERMGG